MLLSVGIYKIFGTMTNGNLIERKHLRPSNGNISITGTLSQEDHLQALGDVLALKLGQLIKVKVSATLFRQGDGENAGKRLLLCVCEGDLDVIQVKLAPNFNFHHNGSKESPCLRVWGFPIEFLAPRAEDLKSKWKDLFQFVPRINRRGDLSLTVSSQEGESELVEEFRQEIEKDFPDLKVRNKQKPRRGDAVPGFVIIFSVSALKESVDEEGELLETSKEALQLQHSQLGHGIPAGKLLELTVAYLPTEDRIKVIKSLLPEGVGLYNTNEPMTVDGGSAKVNSL